jgi:long-chain acyl-CoA synthetase
MYRESELSYFLKEGQIRAIITGDELYTRIERAIEGTESPSLVITAHYRDFVPDTPVLSLSEELKQPKRIIQSAYDLREILETVTSFKEHVTLDVWNDIGLMVFTSGTTGRPKGALLSYGSALYKTAATTQVNQIKAEDRTLVTSPLCHIAGMVMGVNLPVYSGSQCVLLTRFDPNTTIDAIEHYKITNWYSVAPMNAAILQMPGIEKRDLTSLRYNMSTSFGLPVTKKLADQWKMLTKGCIMYEAAYGLSETHTCDTFMPIDNIKFGSCGIPVYENEIRILDIETGVPVPRGERGEIVVKNRGVFKGYLNRPEATAETLCDGWVHTGDIGMLDEDGYLYFSGRLKELIKCSGYSVFPEDVEALVNEHPAVQKTAVVGVPDPARGESVKAFIVLKNEYKGKVTEHELIEWSKQHMAAYKYPRFIEFLDELPATSSGKVLRRLLKETQKKEV